MGRRKRDAPPHDQPDGTGSAPPARPRQVAILLEAASEVSRACPWIPVCGDGRTIGSLVDRGLLGATHCGVDGLFGIMPAGCRAIRRRDHGLAMRALAGLRRNRDQGEVMPWDV